jgi:hypothetical protein
MKIKFIKDHPVGIKKGLETIKPDAWSKQMIEAGYAEEVKAQKVKKPSKTKELK